MDRTVPTTSAAILVVAMMFPSHAGGQGWRLPTGGSLAIGLEAGSMFGDDFDLTQFGLGGFLALRFTTAVGIQLGAGVDINTRGAEVDNSPRQPAFTLLSLYVEPRYVARRVGPVAPFLGGQFGWVRLFWGTPDSESIRSTAYRAGAVTGLNVQAGPQSSVEFGLRLDFVSFGDLSLAGTRQPNTGLSGPMFQGFAGFVISFQRFRR